MGMNFDGKDLKEQFHAAFGRELETITPQQMRWLVCFAKHVRFRCRSNKALNPYLSRNFRHLQFREVMKEGPRGPYPSLEITGKNSSNVEETVAEANDESSE